MSDNITIENGKELRKWTTFFITLVLALAAGIAAFTSLQGQVVKNSENIDRLCQETRLSIRNIQNSGTLVATQNQRDIIGLKKDIQYTARTVSKIADKLGVVEN